jgi:hypothetical protein
MLRLTLSFGFVAVRTFMHFNLISELYS